MDNSYNKLKDFFIDLFFPKLCLGCQREGTYLCDDCRSLLDIAEFDYCLCNKNPLRLEKENGKCQKCQDKKLSGLYFALPYKENSLTKKLIYQFKYQPYIRDLAKTLASILIEHFVITEKNTNKIWNDGILIPVPLDKKEMKIRGYNQSEELAKELSKILQIPVISDSLIKIASTKPQIKSFMLEREKYLDNIFIIKNPEQISGKKIFLVDDVYTTGSAMEECSKVLKEINVKSVWGIVIAREE